MDIGLFDYELPEELIAQTPLPNRTSSRLMSLNKATGEVGHHTFEQLQQFVNAGDLLVLNDTRVIPARLFGVKADTGAKIELLLLNNLGDDRWEVLAKSAKRARIGTEIHFFNSHNDSPELTAHVEEEQEMGGRIVRFRYSGIFHELLDRLGQVPLPPYIKQQLEDKERYQTVYARHEGSAAAPTAGLHFSELFLQSLERQGVGIAYITLHVGLGTFRPVSVERVEEHHMHSEYYHIPEQAAAQIQATREAGGRIFAVGTTATRTLETAAREDGGPIQACQGWTDIFIYPGYRFKLIDGLLTNFHLPKSTLMMLISALAGREHVLNAYREAVRERYRFFSFGDAMIII
jgi:S-adenosylmethionine:tRNA ribosyltransferase-isomerase